MIRFDGEASIAHERREAGHEDNLIYAHICAREEREAATTWKEVTQQHYRPS
jgi:hypothetical protein